MTDNEIKKALECCISDNPPCTTCKYDPDTTTCDECMGNLMKDALDYINRLEAEVDDLKRDDLPRCKDALRRANENGMALEKENQELKAEIERLKEFEYMYNDLCK